MRILLTGHRGYIGAVMAPMLQAEGHQVVGLDSDIFAQCSFSRLDLRFPEILKDLRDVTARDVDGFDAVIHLAAVSNDPIGDLNPEVTYDINHRGSLRLARLAKAGGCSRFLFSSSCSIYGAAGGEAPLTEEARFNPVTAYANSKVLLERDLAGLADDDFSPVYLRNATAYGASPRLRFDLVLNNLVAHAYTTGLVYMLSDGTPWRPIVHIRDIARAFIAALDAPREVVHNQAFNVGLDDQNYRMIEVAEIVREVVPRCRIEFSPEAGPDKRSYRVDFGKIRSLLPGFQPEWDARRGAQELLAAYRQVQLSRDDFEGPRFRRMEQIKLLTAAGRLGADLRLDAGVLAGVA